MVARGRGRGVGEEQGVPANEHGVSLWGDENVLEPTKVMAAQLHEHAKQHGMIPFKWVECVVCEFISLKLFKKTEEET